MSRIIRPEPQKGVFMDEADYCATWMALSKLPRGRLLELVNRLWVGWDPEARGGFIESDVSFGRWDGPLERVRGETLEVVLGKALALAIDRRLAAVARARADIDLVTKLASSSSRSIERERVEGVDSLTWALERLLLAANVPAELRPKLTAPPEQTGREQTGKST